MEPTARWVVERRGSSRWRQPGEFSMRGESNSFQALCREASNCRECFTLGEVSSAGIDVAQPRWVGGKYWDADIRIVILMCNPGEGLNYPASVKRVRLALHEFRQGNIALDTILEDQRNAGWARFYIDGLRLNIDDVAFANVAWCATKGNRYPRTVLDRCFTRHAERALALLSPDVVLVAGRKAQGFLQTISHLPRTPTVIRILHHAHRKGRLVEQIEFDRIRQELMALQVHR
jgi:hypothetical protein